MTSTLITGAKEITLILEYVSYIYYSIQFKKNTDEIQALINSESKINVMTPAYGNKLSFQMQKTNVRAQKIDGSILKTYKMVIVGFQVQDKFRRARFFQKTFLIADTNIKVIFGMFFPTCSKIKVDFAEEELIQKTYTAVDILPITKKVYIIDLKKFAKIALDQKQEIFVVHITACTMELIKINPDYKVLITALIANKALVTVPIEYSDFTDVFSKKSAVILSKHTKINIHAIDLEEDKQSPYGFIYSLGPVEL